MPASCAARITASSGASESRVEGSGDARSTTGQAQAATGTAGGTRAAGQGASTGLGLGGSREGYEEQGGEKT